METECLIADNSDGAGRPFPAAPKRVGPKAALFGLAFLFASFSLFAADTGFGPPISVPRDLPVVSHTLPTNNWISQTTGEAFLKSQGCLQCHNQIENWSMHQSKNVILGCTDCHGGNPTPGLTMRKAHVLSRHPEFWISSANPADSDVVLNHESPEFIQFVNPGDLRVAQNACGLCHQESVDHVNHSMMNHGAQLWGAALYNNGAFPLKSYRFGQAYGPNGEPLTLFNPTPVTPEDTRLHGILPFIEPLPQFPISQPSNILRIFEKGQEEPLSLGIPNPEEDPGRPAHRLSERGLGTGIRTDPVYLNVVKMRLHNPLLGFLGSNNHPGDYRSSGCSACHVVYANDRSPVNSAYYSKYGNQGLSFTQDTQIPKNERAHPIQHVLTRAIPTSQCMVCHMHQGDLFVNPFVGYTWWDQETDGEFMYPKKQHDPTDAEMVNKVRYNPEGTAARGLWDDIDFLEKVSELNTQMTNTQFADYHGHGWNFRAVFKKDRQGNLLDADNKLIDPNDPHKFAKAVHLNDIHLAHGMQCVDCHFENDVHGNGNLYGDARAATTIECIDCHGTVDKRPTLMASGNGRDGHGGVIDLNQSAAPWGPRFVWQGKRLFQYSTLSPDVRWEIPQTMDTVDPSSPIYNAKSAYAKTMRHDGVKWGDVPPSGDCPRLLAHDNSKITCQVCHSSWATSCFGCHLPMKANQRTPLTQYDGIITRNFTSYNPQVVRDDVFMLGLDSTVKSNRLAVLRSSSAIIVGSQNSNREWVYSQQQTVSAEGYSGQAFNPHFPHTTSGVNSTKNCSDCHLAKENDNNAIMTQLLGFGTGTVNFFGRYAYVGEGKGGLDAVVWTERDEPQAAYGSHLQKLAYPSNYDEHVVGHKAELKEAYHHEGKEILDLIQRGEYLYTANGADGFEVFDVANIDNKGFSERIISAPVSPLGQRTYVRTKYATSVTLPSTLGIDPLRIRQTNNFVDPKYPQLGELYQNNEEQPISYIYAWVFITDKEEGLVMATVGTLVDGAPDNNFLDHGNEKVIRYNPDGKLTGAMHSFMAGTNLYVVAQKGLFVLGLSDTTLDGPKMLAEISDGQIKNPRAVGVQFRYAFVTDEEGFKTVDITDPSHPKMVPGAVVPLKNAQRFYLARTYAYVADGEDGLAFIDITNPEKPKLERLYNADGALTDTRSVQIGSISASMYALVADGKNGLRVIQMISPENVAGAAGFSPVPNPKLIATFPTREPAVAVGRGLDRDRVVDETGNQTVVFGRRGSRPFHVDEMEKFYKHADGSLFTVEDNAMKDGQLTARDGTKLSPSETYKAPPGPPAPPPPSRDRLVRRGQ